LGPRYSSSLRINGDQLNVDLIESEIRGQTTQFDLNPLIYVRFGRPLKETAKLPTFEADNKEDAGFDYDKYNKLDRNERIRLHPD